MRSEVLSGARSLPERAGMFLEPLLEKRGVQYTPTAALSDGRRHYRSAVTRDQCASGRNFTRIASQRPETSRIPSPNPIPSCGHSIWRPESLDAVWIGEDGRTA